MTELNVIISETGRLKPILAEVGSHTNDSCFGCKNFQT